MAQKINRENAQQRISEMLNGYEKRERDNRYGGQKEYYVMTESEFRAAFESVLASCTKEMRKHIERYSQIEVGEFVIGEGIKDGCSIRIWSTVYAAVEII